MKTFSRVYDTYGQASQVVTELETAGVPRSEISVVANKNVSAAHDDVTEVSGASTGAGIGAAVGGAGGLLAGLGLMAIPGIGPVVALGWFASTALGAVAGAATGGIIGALTDIGVPKEHAEVYSEAIRRGGTLVTVRTEDANAARVDAILTRHAPLDPALRMADYRKQGWKGYDPKAPPYPLSEEDRQRIRAPYRGIEEPRMDWNRVEGNWKQLKGKVKEQWGKLTDDDLDVIRGRRDQLEGKIQERYGYARDQVRNEVDAWYGSQRW